MKEIFSSRHLVSVTNGIKYFSNTVFLSFMSVMSIMSITFSIFLMNSKKILELSKAAKNDNYIILSEQML